MIMSRLPPFLLALDTISDSSLPYKNAVYQHSGPLGLVHAQWWPCGAPPKAIVLFIPGNPGLLDFYAPFLSAFHRLDTSSRLAILSHGHIGHAPWVEHTNSGSSLFNLPCQVQSAMEAFDAVRSYCGPQTKIILLGHSVGSWIALQVLKARPDVSGLFLLFPTISHIARTPSGLRLSWLFKPPMPRIISSLSHITKLLPLSILCALFRTWPLAQVLVLRSFLHSPSAIFATLTMANDEMNTIGDLDVTLFNENRHLIWMYYAEKDDWVGDQRDAVLAVFGEEPGIVKAVRGHRDIPHAFCINHGTQLAAQCFEWLRSGDFVQ